MMTLLSCTFFSFVVLLISFPYCSRAQSVPAMYVFGDSLVDVGNNNHLPLSLVKADFPYNGIDYPGRRATGRFSNGKNAADFLAENLGLETAPPYLSQQNGVFVKGVSFASGGAGIFNVTDDTRIKQTIPLAQQVQHFTTVRQGLLKGLGSNTAAEQHLSKSLFPIVIGSNDIIGYYDNAQKTTPQQYVALMVSTLKNQLKGLYNLGARKFLVIGTSTIGCAPKQRYHNATTNNECNNEVNSMSRNYNEGLTSMLQELKSELNEFRYTYFDTYSIFVDFVQNPSTYGFNETKAACCGLGRLRARIPCTPVSLFCSNRNGHVFWDIYHPTEAAARIFINMLFSSGKYVSPITVQQLIAEQNT